MSSADTSGWDRPLSRAMRADGAPAFLDDYVAAGGYEGLRRALRGAEAGGRHEDRDRLRPARPRRRRLLHRAQVEHDAAGRRTRRTPSTSSATATRWSRAASRTATCSPATRTCSSRACWWPPTPCRRTRATSSCERSTTSPTPASSRRSPRRPRAGYLGERILGSGFSFEIFLHESIGRYICGEASAMLNALESQRPNPRARPPHMTGAGLYARPTVVNNVETLCAVPSIVRNGADWWKSLSALARGRHQDLRRRRARAAAGLRGAADGHLDARAHRGARRRHAARLRAARREPRRGLDGVRPRRRHRRRHGLRLDGDRPAAASAPARWSCSTTRRAPSA